MSYQWRPLRPDEAELLSKLLKVEFPGRHELCEQASNVLVCDIDSDGSLKIRTLSRSRAAVERRVPLQGRANDSDGIPIVVLLHVVDGFLDELEIFKADGTKIINRPDPRNLDVELLKNDGS